MPKSFTARREYAIDKLHADVTVTYGTLETADFQRQSRDFAAAVKAAGKPRCRSPKHRTTTIWKRRSRSAIPTDQMVGPRSRAHETWVGMIKESGYCRPWIMSGHSRGFVQCPL